MKVKVTAEVVAAWRTFLKISEQQAMRICMPMCMLLYRVWLAMTSEPRMQSTMPPAYPKACSLGMVEPGEKYMSS